MFKEAGDVGEVHISLGFLVGDKTQLLCGLMLEILANAVESTGDVFFVPAFSGLFAPYWQPDARG
jgi:hypothetical protein